jgi:hypothetical protein
VNKVKHQTTTLIDARHTHSLIKAPTTDHRNTKQKQETKKQQCPRETRRGQARHVEGVKETDKEEGAEWAAHTHTHTHKEENHKKINNGKYKNKQ